VQQRSRELTQAGVDVVVASFEPPERIRDYVAAHKWSFPVVSDVDRGLYTHLQLTRASFGRVWGFKVLKWYARALWRGRRLGRLDGDLYQLGGDFLVRGNGDVVWAYRSLDPADRPSVDQVLREVEVDSAS
jgi:hypothetical protein